MQSTHRLSNQANSSFSRINPVDPNQFVEAGNDFLVSRVDGGPSGRTPCVVPNEAAASSTKLAPNDKSVDQQIDDMQKKLDLLKQRRNLFSTQSDSFTLAANPQQNVEQQSSASFIHRFNTLPTPADETLINFKVADNDDSETEDDDASRSVAGSHVDSISGLHQRLDSAQFNPKRLQVHTSSLYTFHPTVYTPTEDRRH